jgi:hypothetical protein
VSYTIWLDGPAAAPCPTCGRSSEVENPRCPDPTYNLTPIFDLALTGAPYPNPDVTEGQAVILGAPTDRPRGLRILHGRKAGETRADLARAINRICDPAREAEFKALEPANRWGTFDGAVATLRMLLRLADANPEHTWSVT